MVKKGEIVGQRECIYKGNEKQHVLAFLEESVKFLEESIKGGSIFRLET